MESPTTGLKIEKREKMCLLWVILRQTWLGRREKAEHQAMLILWQLIQIKFRSQIQLVFEASLSVCTPAPHGPSGLAFASFTYGRGGSGLKPGGSFRQQFLHQHSLGKILGEDIHTRNPTLEKLDLVGKGPEYFLSFQIHTCSDIHFRLRTTVPHNEFSDCRPNHIQLVIVNHFWFTKAEISDGLT